MEKTQAQEKGKVESYWKGKERVAGLISVRLKVRC